MGSILVIPVILYIIFTAAAVFLFMKWKKTKKR
jgi:hypothetical protein